MSRSQGRAAGLVGFLALLVAVAPQIGGANAEPSTPLPHTDNQTFLASRQVVKGAGADEPLSGAERQDMEFAAKEYGISFEEL